MNIAKLFTFNSISHIFWEGKGWSTNPLDGSDYQYMSTNWRITSVRAPAVYDFFLFWWGEALFNLALFYCRLYVMWVVPLLWSIQYLWLVHTVPVYTLLIWSCSCIHYCMSIFLLSHEESIKRQGKSFVAKDTRMLCWYRSKWPSWWKPCARSSPNIFRSIWLIKWGLNLPLWVIWVINQSIPTIVGCIMFFMGLGKNNCWLSLN